jgi:hypothetical protein
VQAGSCQAAESVLLQLQGGWVGGV